MAEFLTMAEAEDKFGKKGRTNAVNTAINTVADRCPSCTAQ
jgi:hypothetical protein